MKNQVLDHKKIIRICNRLAYQIIENSENKKSIILVGIKEKGYEVSKLIMQELNKICSNKIILRYIEIDKTSPKNSLKCNLESTFKSSEKVFLIDDVLNTGKTLMYSVNKLLDYDFNSIKTVVLIDRNHKKFPVKVDFKGISLSTNYDDIVKLNFKKNNLEAIIT
ncbi:MAG: phosphoribosyltransferase family protein [Flavobacteriaceae bacterium]|jgi:pyrimidine operon attenuation protein/uracil phosphoribosyltransferase|tara:strand:- start:660 stop:1154 length:495 start_codon:yes stop_codon:yes gene_type:complete